MEEKEKEKNKEKREEFPNHGGATDSTRKRRKHSLLPVWVLIVQTSLSGNTDN
jgi:hypothetical protein